MNKFKMKKWFKLDTAALIFPAVMNQKWANAFRVTATLRDPIEPEVLQQAVKDLKNRFPTFYVRLVAGFFWYRLEDAEEPPQVMEDYAYPLVHMSKKELKHQCMRVLYYKNRISVEVFHSITDGNGGIFFLKNLLRRYIELQYGKLTQDTEVLLPIDQNPKEEELEDSFFKYASKYPNTDKEEPTYHIKGTTLEGKSTKLIIGTLETEKLLEVAHAYNTSVTCFLAAVLLQSYMELQAAKCQEKHQKVVKISIPVDLRRLFGSKTLRNFVLQLNIGVNPRLGEYSLQDLSSCIYHQLKAKATKQYMGGMIAENTLPQELLALRLAPLPIKTFVMNLVYSIRGETAGSINLSNLGQHSLPREIEQYVDTLSFIIGVQRSYFNNCSVVSYKGKTRISMIRCIEESELERLFFSKLVEIGIPVEIESN